MLYMALVHSPYPHARIVKNRQERRDGGARRQSRHHRRKISPVPELDWIPTFHGYDKQMVLAVGKVLYQYQEVAGVFADLARNRRRRRRARRSRLRAARPQSSIRSKPKPTRSILRDDREQKTNHIYHWEVGDRADDGRRARRRRRSSIKQRIGFQRCHPAPLEPCGVIADINTATGRLTFYLTSQAPHAHRTVVSLVTGIPEDKIHIISPDIGGGFGNKVPVYPGYVVATVASVMLGVPVKWIETRTENLTTTGLRARLPHGRGDRRDERRKVTALKVTTVADHGAFDAAADPTQVSGRSVRHRDRFVRLSRPPSPKSTPTSPTRHPGGIAYRCSFRVTEASFAIERAMDILARQAQDGCRRPAPQNFVKKEQFPYPSPLGFVYDSGDYHTDARQGARHRSATEALRKEQAEKRARGELMGIGISTFTEVVGAGPSKHFDIMGIKMFDSAEIRIHPTGSGIVRAGTKSARVKATRRRGRRSSPKNWASIRKSSWSKRATPTRRLTVWERMPAAARRSPARRSRWPRAAFARRRTRSRRICSRPPKADVEWKDYKFQVKGVPGKSVTMKDVAFAAYTNPAPESSRVSRPPTTTIRPT